MTSKCCKLRQALSVFAERSSCVEARNPTDLDSRIQAGAGNKLSPFDKALLYPFEHSQKAATGAFYFNAVRWEIQDLVCTVSAPNYERVVSSACLLLEYFKIRNAPDKQLRGWAKYWQALSLFDRDLAFRWSLGLRFDETGIDDTCNACFEQTDDGIWLEDYRQEYPDEGPHFIKTFMLPLLILIRLCHYPEELPATIDSLRKTWLTPDGWRIVKGGLKALYRARSEDQTAEIVVPTGKPEEWLLAEIIN